MQLRTQREPRMSKNFDNITVLGEMYFNDPSTPVKRITTHQATQEMKKIITNSCFYVCREVVRTYCSINLLGDKTNIKMNQVFKKG